MIFRPALLTLGHDLAAWHCDKRTVVPFDDLQISHDKTVVERDATKSSQAIGCVLHKLDTNFSDDHAATPGQASPGMRSAVGVKVNDNSRRTNRAIAIEAKRSHGVLPCDSETVQNKLCRCQTFGGHNNRVSQKLARLGVFPGQAPPLRFVADSACGVRRRRARGL